jgi:superfamily II DNA or RNA helicase
VETVEKGYTYMNPKKDINDKNIIQLLEKRIKYLEQLLIDNNISFDRVRCVDLKTSLNNQDKLEIYKSYFKGRKDCYAVRWEKDGKSGYSPVYLDHVKYLPKEAKSKLYIKELYKPMNDDALISHLVGHETLGVYPMLDDQTCYFLAFDFDDQSWKADVINLSNTLKKENISYLIEISRSGKGAHLWLFFEHPVLAKDARRFGRYILTRTMMTYGISNFRSYDRMFPTQDFVEKEGIGNLIALPLQGKSGKNGTTLFVDDEFQIYQNQYEKIKSTHKITIEHFNHLLEQISKTDELGLFNDKAKDIDMDLFDIDFDELQIKVYNQIIIIKKKLSARAIQYFKRTSSVVNPDFYKKQNMRVSTYGISRIIELYEEDHEHLYLPIGALNLIKEKLDKHNILYELIDLRSKPKMKHKLQFQVTLTSDQHHVLEKLVKGVHGVLIAPTGFGKTIIGVALASKIGLKTLIIIHRESIAQQWRDKVKEFLNISEVGRLDKDHQALGFDIDIVLIQSLSKYSNLDEISNQYGLIIIDEVHHLASPSYERCIRKFSAKHIIGLTATLKRSDGLEKIVTTMLGPVIVDVSHIENEMYKRLYTRLTNFKLSSMAELAIHNAYKEIIDNNDRNGLILNDIKDLIEQKKNILILTDRIEHFEFLMHKVKEFSVKFLCIHGQMTRKEKTEFQLKLEIIEDGFVILSTGKYIGEGFDNNRLDTLLLTMPFRWRGTLQQYIGRLSRVKSGKNEISVYDYADVQSKFFSAMYLERLKGYKQMGFTITASMDMESTIYHRSDYLSKLHNDLSIAKEVAFLIRKSNYQKVRDLVNKSAVKPVLFNHNEMISNMIIIDDKYIWYGSINPFIYAHKKDDDILRYEDAMLAKQLVEEAKQIISEK